jgi:hypothetical protein
MRISEVFAMSTIELIFTINRELNALAEQFDGECAISSLKRERWSSYEEWCNVGITLAFTRDGEEVNPFDEWNKISYTTIVSGWLYEIIKVSEGVFERSYNGAYEGLGAQSHQVGVFVPGGMNALVTTSLIKGREMSLTEYEMLRKTAAYVADTESISMSKAFSIIADEASAVDDEEDRLRKEFHLE